ncbi:Uroporphyrinogen-III synthase [Elsinoe australis]|uniref:Uroporphyrinogen-III synthase n=1 Tax=Elsinoe australis TaxID=40998 RepID=A0A2P7ZDS8_9PEZI|nr:Uroporphyrinogen-III synthase [Elsinoe australis]
MPDAPDSTRVSGMPVLLLKTKSAPTDGYEEYFENIQSVRFKPRFVAVLQHQFVEESLRWLREVIEDGCFTHSHQVGGETDRFGGMIFTSQRSVEGFSRIARSLSEEQKHRLLPEGLQLFVVGPATAKAVRALELPCTILGEHTGNGDVLSDFILDNYKSPLAPTGQRLPLLFLVGEQRRDIIPNKLQNAVPEQSRIPVIERTVYGTAEKEDFGDEFEKILQCRPRSIDMWVVVFSPSGCRAMLRKVGWLNDKGEYDRNLARTRSPGIYVATIGPTTRDFLKRQFSFQPHVCADTPSPEGVGKGIMEYMEGHG